MIYGSVLKRQVEGPEAGAGEEERYGHGKEQDVVVDAVREELLVFGLEAELDDEDEGIQEGRELGIEADHQEYGYEYLYRSIYDAVRAGAGAAAPHLLIAEIGQSDAEDDAYDERRGLLVSEQGREHR